MRMAGVGLVLALALVCAPAAAERILSFDVDVFLGEEDRFQVVERIRWDFGALERHGIYREIPVAYGRGRSADYHIRLEVEAVEMDGEPVPWRVRTRDGVLRVRIGDPDRKITGAHEYELRYRVGRGLLFLEDHDELYWNATGDMWKVPMDRATASVYLPTDTGSGVDAACFTGRRGSVRSDCTFDRGLSSVTFRADAGLGPGEGLTLVLGLPKGVVREPTVFERFLDRVRDYLSAWLLLPLATFAGALARWRSHGRDPQVSDAIPVRYEPPEGLTPAEVGTLLDERADLRDLTSTLLDLAIRGYLRIDEVEGEHFLFLKHKDYRLVKLREPDDLRVHEKLMMGSVFAGRDEVLVSSLKDRFHRHLATIKGAVYRGVSGPGRYFFASPQRVRQLWAGAGVAVMFVGGFLLISVELLSAGLAFLASGAVLLAFSPAMPRRTRRGRAAYEEILGFKEFLARVDADRLERMGTRTTELFERVLPHAVVLGVADAWADAFADLYTQPPNWYTSSRYGSGFHPTAFVSDVGSSLDTMGSTLASTPRSSGSGSSGFGGGGFSGGGFGGGGGGSW